MCKFNLIYKITDSNNLEFSVNDGWVYHNGNDNDITMELDKESLPIEGNLYI